MIAHDSLPDYLPARMLNEFVYCPRLFWFEWVDGVFAHNQETVEGAIRHSRVDGGSGALPSARGKKKNKESASEPKTSESDRDPDVMPPEPIHCRSVMLSSDQYRLIAKLDLVEADGETATPVDYKRGSPKENRVTGEIEAWDADRVQICVQALVLRDNGFACSEGMLYYAKTRQRVRVAIDDALVNETLTALVDAKKLVTGSEIPPPLIDSPKCPKCSLVGICLPDETAACDDVEDPLVQLTLFEVEPKKTATAKPTARTREGDIRRLIPARDDLKPLYLNTQGFSVGKSGNVLRIKDKEKVVQEVRMNDICQLSLFGNIQITTQTIQTLCENEIPIAYFSMGGWFYGVTQGLGVKNIALRREQFRLADVPGFCLRLARALVAGKIRNQRTMLQRNHIEPPNSAITMMKCMIEQAEEAQALDELLGIEGNAARVYFENFGGMIKKEEEDPFGGPPEALFAFDFNHRNRRPPRDPVNALLSLAYSILAKDLTIVTQAVGFDPYLGYYHQPRFGRASLALDLMEPFRPLIADSAVLSAINTRMVTPNDFVRAGDSVALTESGRKAFFRAYEQRMDTLVTHPLFGYRVNYRRMLEIQTRLLARVLTGEITTYPVFVTR